MVEIEERLEEHHRRPEGLGGTNKPSNISFVPIDQHKAYHVLYGSLNAYQTADKINKTAPTGFMVVCEFINGVEVKKRGRHDSKNPRKLRKAEEVVFGDMSFEDKIAYINNVWLDPSYHLYIVKIPK